MDKNSYLLGFCRLKNPSKKLIREKNFSLNAKVFWLRKLIPAKNTSFKVYNFLEVDGSLI